MTTSTDRDDSGFLTAAAVAKLTDDQVLALAGPCGPSLIGAPLAERAAAVQKNRVVGTGVEQLIVGPALIDPNYNLRDKTAPAVPAAPTGAVTPPLGGVTEATEPADPWAHVSKSGMKELAKAKKVKVAPNASKAVLQAALEAAGVAPPPVPKE